MTAVTRFASDQLRFPLLRDAKHDRAGFVAGASNHAALEALDAWPDAAGPGATGPGAAGRVLALAGPEGAGKSHLGAIWAQRTHAVHLTGPRAGRTEMAELEGSPILLDDADRTEPEALFHLINLTQSTGGALLMIAREPPALWGAALPDLASRLAAARVVRVEAPDDQVMEAILRRLFDERAMTPSDDLIVWLIRRIERSVPAARSLVQRLDAESGSRAINRALARDLLEQGDPDTELFG